MNPPADLLGLAALILFAWLAGCLLLAVLTALPGTKGRARELWPLMASEAGILLAGTVPWLLPQSVLGLFLVVAAGRLGYESGTVNGGAAQHNAGWLGACLLIGIALTSWFAGGGNWPFGLAIVAVMVAGVAFATARNERLEWLWRFLCFPSLPFACFVFAAGWLNAAFVFLLSFLLVEIFDSFSLLGGRLIGSRLLAPRISPKKTWEGLAVGLVAVAVSSVALDFILGKDLTLIAPFAVIAIAGAVAGDLVASAAKRRAGVKDYPVILPVQGGLLDIMDAWIVAGPLAVLAAILLQ